MVKGSSSILFLSILISFNMLNAQSVNKILDVKMVDEIIIGDVTLESAKYIFGEIENIFTDSKGKIYITDSEALTIWVFDENGNYLKSIGRRGRGPGEFLSFGYSFVNNEDEIFVPDPRQFRITKFNTNGEVLRIYNTSKYSQDINFFMEVIPYKNERFLALYFKHGNGRFAKYAREGLFHIWDSTFQNELEAYGSFDQLGYTKSYGRRFIRTKVGTMAEMPNNDLLMAPFLYKGIIFSYKKNGDGWAFNKKIEGFEPWQPASVTLDKSDSDAGSIHSVGLKTVYGKVNILSSGIFILNNEYITHFSVRRNNESGWDFGVELYNMNYNYIGYFKLSIINDLYTYHAPLVQWKDEKGRFYMLGERDGIPIVRVFTIDISKN